jgi:hypothetical protein
MSHGHTRHRNSYGQFISDTEHLLDRLRPELETTRARLGANAEKHSELKDQCAELLDQHVQDTVPDLSARTIAKLKTSCPGFFTEREESNINGALHSRVPFWTWVFGGSTKYRTNVAARELDHLRELLSAWLVHQIPRPALIQDVADLELQLVGLEEERRTLSEKEARLSAQIDSLGRVRDRYSQPNAPEPPAELREAVTNSSSQMRTDASSPAAGGADTSSGGGFGVMDYLILDSILHRDDRRAEIREVHHYEERPSYEDRPVTREEVSRVDEGGGGSSRLVPEEADGGGGSSRLAAEDADGGGGSSRLAENDGDGGGGSSRVEAESDDKEERVAATEPEEEESNDSDEGGGDSETEEA